MRWAWLVVLVVAGSVAYVLRQPAAGGPRWLVLLLSYAALAALAAARLRGRVPMTALLRFRPGDPSLGIALGLLLLLGSWAIAELLLPAGSPGHAWVYNVALLLGGASGGGLTACLTAIGILEEWVWRGWVQTELSERVGVRRGWVITALLYALAHAPSLFTLADPAAGPNPLLVLAALGCGLCWGFVRERTGRLMPAFFSHAAFTYLAAQYLWRFI